MMGVMAKRDQVLAAWRLLAAGAALGLLATAQPAHAAPPLVGAPPASARPGSEGDRSFAKFCDVWMGKLARRERDNLKSARPRNNGGTYVIEYIGYGNRPLRCEAKATGKRANPFIGKMVYTEHQYRREGSTGAKARKGSAALVSATEVMEIFRFDGKRWVY